METTIDKAGNFSRLVSKADRVLVDGGSGGSGGGGGIRGIEEESLIVMLILFKRGEVGRLIKIFGVESSLEGGKLGLDAAGGGGGGILEVGLGGERSGIGMLALEEEFSDESSFTEYGCGGGPRLEDKGVGFEFLGGKWEGVVE